MQQCRVIYYSLAALHVSSDIFPHYQEHLNCITAPDITHVCRYRLVSWECWNVRIIYYSLAVLHVSSDIFAHHQEHLNCITASGIKHVCRCRLVSWECWNVRIIYYSLAALHVSSDIFAHYQEHLNCITASVITHVCRCRLVHRPKHVELIWNNKLIYIVHLVGYLHRSNLLLLSERMRLVRHVTQDMALQCVLTL